MTPAARESGREARRDNSKGRLIHTRNSFFYPRERRVIRSVRAEKREEESGRASGQRINYTQCSTTSAAMESKTSHLQSSGLSLKKPSRVEGHPYDSRRGGIRVNPHALPTHSFSLSATIRRRDAGNQGKIGSESEQRGDPWRNQYRLDRVSITPRKYNKDASPPPRPCARAGALRGEIMVEALGTR